MADAKIFSQNESLLQEMEILGPWHMRVSLNDELHTGMTGAQDGAKLQSPSLLNKEKHFKWIINKAYPDGLKGKTFFDHACNSGGFCFWAKELGADATFGYDVREHWIKQAEFIRKNRTSDTSNMRFEVMDLYDVPKHQDIGSFDITWFSGIFYHLPDPVTGLKIAAEKTKDLIYISTATQNYIDPEPKRGALFGSYEGKDYVMTGVHNLNWFPSGPNCLANILKWLGFPHMRIIRWSKQVVNSRRPGDKARTVGRISVVAAREKERVKAFRRQQILESVNSDFEKQEMRHNEVSDGSQ
jgi:tRNA (mo5U34)-methyltransferase